MCPAEGEREDESPQTPEYPERPRLPHHQEEGENLSLPENRLADSGSN